MTLWIWLAGFVLLAIAGAGIAYCVTRPGFLFDLGRMAITAILPALPRIGRNKVIEKMEAKKRKWPEKSS